VQQATGSGPKVFAPPLGISPANAVGIGHRMSAVLGFTAALRVTTGDVPGLATKSK
jgi:hypothetical protein